jgi:hypothetical protein
VDALCCLCEPHRHFSAEYTVPFLAPAFARLLDVSDPALDNSADARDVNLVFVWMVKHLPEIDAAANHRGDNANASRMESGRPMGISITDKYPWNKT